MKLGKFFTAISIIALSGATIAGTVRSSIVNLDHDSTIPPTGMSVVSLGGLLENAEYEVYCTLISDNKDKSADVNSVKITNAKATKLDVELNGTKLSSNGQGEIATERANGLVVHRATQEKDNSIFIRNLDNTDTISVNNCYAKPTVG